MSRRRSRQVVGLWAAGAVAVGFGVTGCADTSQRSAAHHDHRSASAGTHHRVASAHHKKHPAQPTATRTSGNKRHHVAGVPLVDLPNRALTPGAVLSTSRRMICTPGYATSVRDVPESEQTAIYARYQVAHVPYAHEVDHLVSLELGGSNALTNLWPEPYAGRWGARTKDALENKLHDLVCAGQLNLVGAQHIEATNWVAAYWRYIGAPPAAPTSHTSTPSPSTGTGCEPGYSPCLPRAADLNCADIPAADKPVRVTGSDPYALDADHDGWGCTS
jgi:5-methylcytosine-specific restriction endonuclease McrA